MFPRLRIHLPQTVLALSSSALFLAGTTGFAQVAYDAQIPFSVSEYTLADPAGVAVAPDGTVYVADIQSSSTAYLIKITPTTGTVGGTGGGAADIAATGVKLTPSGLGKAMKRPTAVVVDSTGILYVADAGSHQVIEIANPESSTSPAAVTVSYGTATENPTALAVDSSNNLYIADEGQGAIYEVTGGVATALSIGSGFKPAGLALDSAGDVYFADVASNEVYEYDASTKATAVFLSSTVGFDFSGGQTVLPIGMGVDPAGDVYVLNGQDTQLIEATSSSSYFDVPFTSIGDPGSVALSSTGNIYMTDDSHEAVDEIYYNNNPVNFGSIDAGIASPEVTLNYNFISAEANVAWYQSVQGDKTGEFANPSAYPCGTGDLSSAVAKGYQCSFVMEVTYLAQTPGERSGAFGLSYGAKTTTYAAVPAVGVDVAGSLVLYSTTANNPGTQSVLSQSSQTLYEPQAVAVTGDGDTVFIADEGGIMSTSPPTYTHPGVYAYAVTPGLGGHQVGTPSSTPTDVSCQDAFQTPTALALDAVGNLYVADYAGFVCKVPPTSNWTTSGTALSLPAGTLNHPMSLAVDPSGNLYIGDMGPAGSEATVSSPGYIVKVPADGGLPVQLNFTAGGEPVVFPEALTTDRYGNLYIADGGNGQTTFGDVDVVDATNGSVSATSTVSQISFGAFADGSTVYSLYEPSGLSFDAAGDLYVLDGYSHYVLVIPIDYTGSTPSPDSNDVNYMGFSAENSLLDTLVTPSSLVVWPGGQNVTVTDLGYFPTSGQSSPTQVITAQGYDASVTASPTGQLAAVNVGNQEITFNYPTISGTHASEFSVPSCGNDGTTIEPAIADNGTINACAVTIDYSGTGTSTTAYITLNGITSGTGDDYSALGNLITATGAPDEPLAEITAAYLSPDSVAVTIENVGADALVVAYWTFSSSNAVLTTIGSCTSGISLGTNKSCTVIVTFSGSPGIENGTLVFYDNSGNPPSGYATQTECVYLINYLLGVTGGGSSGTCGFFGTVTPVTGGTTILNKPNTPQNNKVGLPSAPDDSLGGGGSSAIGQGGNVAQPQSQSQPVSTVESGSTPQPLVTFGPAGVVQPSPAAPDDSSVSNDDDSSSTSDDANSTADSDQSNKKKSDKKSDASNSDTTNSGAANANPADSGSTDNGAANASSSSPQQ